jgi:hypothetical protein
MTFLAFIKPNKTKLLIFLGLFLAMASLYGLAVVHNTSTTKALYLEPYYPTFLGITYVATWPGMVTRIVLPAEMFQFCGDDISNLNNNCHFNEPNPAIESLKTIIVYLTILIYWYVLACIIVWLISLKKKRVSNN